MQRRERDSSTNRHRKIFFWGLGTGAAFLGLLAASFLLLPSLVNHSALRDRITAKASEKLGAKIGYERVDLLYFPQPHVVFHQGSISAPGGFSATLKSLTVYPEVFPLLKGKIKINTIHLESPSIKTNLSRAGREGEGEQRIRNPGDLGKKIASALASIAAKTGSPILEMDHGSADLSRGDESTFWFRDVRAKIFFAPDRVRIDNLECRSNLCERLSVTASMGTADFKGEGRMDLVNFRPHLLADAIFPAAPLRIKDSTVNLTVGFRTEGPSSFQAEAKGSIPLLSVARGKEEVTLRGKAFKGFFQIEGQKMEIALSQLDFDDPRLKLSGRFRIDGEAPQVSLEVQSREMDIASTRETALKLAGSLPIIETIFGIVRGGRIPLITFQSRGRSVGDLDETENFIISGSLNEGRISIPSQGFGWKSESLDLDRVSGEVVISKGILEGKKVEARWEGEEVKRGQVRLGLEGEDAPLHLEFVAETDLSRLPGLLKGVIKDAAFLTELARTHDLRGRGTGKLVLGETMRSIGARIEVWEMNLSARYDRLPYPLRIDHGQFSFDGRSIGLKNVSGRMGKSSFSDLTVQLDPGKDLALETLSGNFSISLGEIYPWLASFESLREGLKEIGSIEGTLGLSVRDLKGPLQELSRLRFEATGEVKNCSATLSFFPGPMEVTAGTFRADPGNISFTGVETNVLGASFNFSGRLDGYLKGPLRLDLLSKVDLAKLSVVLRTRVKSEAFEKELSLIEDLRGNASARLVIEDLGGAGKTDLEVSELTASARYRRLPYPIKINGGQVSYGEGRIGVKSLSGALGKSSFSNVAAQLDLGEEPGLEIQSGVLAVSLDEIYAWLSKQESLRDILKDLKTARGTVNLSEVKLKGPLLTPRDWHFQASGDVTAIQVEAAFVPGPIGVSRGTFRVDPEKLSVSNLEVKVLDTSLNVSGALNSFPQELEKVEIDFSGRVTPKDMEWVSDLLHIRHIIHMRTAFSVSAGHLAWNRGNKGEKGGEISLRADLALEDGPQISFEALQKLHELKVNRFLIRDELSHADVTLDLQGRRLGFTFSGSLSEQTLAKILSGHPVQDGWVRGEFKADIRMDQPMQSTAQGRLDVHRLFSPWQPEKPLEIVAGALEGKGNHVSVTGGSLAWGDKNFSLSGDVRFSPKNVLLDLDVSTEDLSVDEVLKAFGGKKGGKQEEDAADLSVEGRIRFNTRSLSYGRYVWAPFQAEIFLLPDHVRIAVTQADLCGISTTGVVEVTPQNLTLDIDPLAKQQHIDPTVRCLLGRDVRTTGAFDFTGHFQGQGESERLLQSLQGNAELTAHKGRIYRFDLLSKILSFINVAGVFAGRLPDFHEKGLSYNSMRVRADLQAGRVLIKEATLEGPTLEIASSGEIDPSSQRIDLMVLVAPFRTIDSVIARIPLINLILGKNLISVPVKVTGPWNDPRITPLSPSAVGSELVGIMKRTLGLPFQIINPLLPKEKQEQKGP